MADDPSKPVSEEESSGLWQKAGDEFILMLGNCITEWSNVEHWLFQICHKALGSEQIKTAIVYYRTPSIDARLSLTDELVRATLPRHAPGAQPHPDLRLWQDTLKEFKDLLPVRNRLAHHPVRVNQRTRFAESIETEVWFESYISQTESLRGRASDLKPLRKDDLFAHLKLVNGLTTRIHNFLHQTLPAHLAKPSPQDARQPQATDSGKGRSTKPQRRRRSSPE
jgi:hypothetical protein